MTPALARCRVATWSALGDRQPTAAAAAGLDLVVVRLGDEVRVLSGRCPHRGARMAAGTVEGPDLVCGAHGWDFRLDTGHSTGIEGECLARFTATIDPATDAVYVDLDELRAWQRDHPQAFDPDEFLATPG